MTASNVRVGKVDSSSHSLREYSLSAVLRRFHFPQGAAESSPIRSCHLLRHPYVVGSVGASRIRGTICAPRTGHRSSDICIPALNQRCRRIPAGHATRHRPRWPDMPREARVQRCEEIRERHIDHFCAIVAVAVPSTLHANVRLGSRRELTAPAVLLRRRVPTRRSFGAGCSYRRG